MKTSFYRHIMPNEYISVSSLKSKRKQLVDQITALEKEIDNSKMSTTKKMIDEWQKEIAHIDWIVQRIHEYQTGKLW